MSINATRKALFAASRELTQAHRDRFNTCKCGSCNPAAVQKCRDADRELQRAAIRFVAELIHDTPNMSISRDDVLGLLCLIK